MLSSGPSAGRCHHEDDGGSADIDAIAVKNQGDKEENEIIFPSSSY